jgi:hypothetical protein
MRTLENRQCDRTAQNADLDGQGSFHFISSLGSTFRQSPMQRSAHQAVP